MISKQTIQTILNESIKLYLETNESCDFIEKFVNNVDINSYSSIGFNFKAIGIHIEDDIFTTFDIISTISTKEIFPLKFINISIRNSNNTIKPHINFSECCDIDFENALISTTKKHIKQEDLFTSKKFITKLNAYKKQKQKRLDRNNCPDELTVNLVRLFDNGVSADSFRHILKLYKSDKNITTIYKWLCHCEFIDDIENVTSNLPINDVLYFIKNYSYCDVIFDWLSQHKYFIDKITDESIDKAFDIHSIQSILD